MCVFGISHYVDTPLQVTPLYSKCGVFLWTEKCMWPPRVCTCRYSYSLQIESLPCLDVFQYSSGMKNKTEIFQPQLQHWSQMTWKKYLDVFCFVFFPQNRVRAILSCKLCVLLQFTISIQSRVFNPLAVSPFSNSYSCQVKWVTSLKTDTETSLKHQFCPTKRSLKCPLCL